MTEKLTTAEVRLAATTNEDLPLTQYKKLESGFDAWLEAIIAEARTEGEKKALATVKIKSTSSVKSPQKTVRPEVPQGDPASARPSRRLRRLERLRREKALLEENGDKSPAES